MKKGIKKTDNYFERNRRIRLERNYRYNFIDYLYYQGERHSKKYLSSSGYWLIIQYWMGFVFWPLLPFWISHYTDILGDILEKMNLTDNLHPIMGILVLFLPMLAAISLPSGLWCLLRYNKDRVAAIKHHYRQSIWKDAIPMWLLWMIPLLFDVLLLVIYLTMIK